MENAPGATFCVHCGSPLPLAPAAPSSLPLEGERRFVTVLFADLSGYTALNEQRDPEAVREIVNACFDRLAPIVEAHRGVIDQFVGDSMLAIFGAPVAHEDDPAQACRVALAMRDALAQLNVERQLELGLHIGINSGSVLAGGVGSRGRQQYSVLGDAVNVASRLQDVAERGEIFVGAETYRLVHEQFDFQSRGAMSLKGKAEPQPVWQLLRARDTVRQRRPLHTTAPLVGRERELALLQRLTREMAAQDAGLRIDKRAPLGHGRGARLSVIAILGEAGLGKSRLVQEWVQWAHRDTALKSLVASCATDGETRALSFLAELAHVLTNEQPTADSALPYTPAQSDLAGDAGKILLGAVPAVSSDLSPADPHALQAQYANALRELLTSRSMPDGLVLVCEDIHWADAPSIRVLQRTLDDWQGAPLLLCLTMRPDADTPGWNLLETLQDLSGVSVLRLHLAPLSDIEAQSLISSIAGTLPDNARRLILAHAEGNPLFVEELVAMLIDRGDLTRENGQWVLTRELAALEVPNTLQGVLTARIDQLPPGARRLLQIAAVLGREFPLAVLEEFLIKLDA